MRPGGPGGALAAGRVELPFVDEHELAELAEHGSKRRAISDERQPGLTVQLGHRLDAGVAQVVAELGQPFGRGAHDGPTARLIPDQREPVPLPARPDGRVDVLVL